jgi:replicative DNA helicase
MKKTDDLLLSLGKLPPQDIELEKTVLGSILIDTDCYENHFFRLSETLFYSTQHIDIYNAIKEAQISFKRVDILTVVKALQKQGKLEQVGGASYIASLTNPIASTANIETHIKLLQQIDVRRKLISFAYNLGAAAYRVDNDSLQLHEQSLRQLSELADFSFESTDLIKINDFITGFKPEFEEKIALANKGVTTGVVTGFKGFDQKIGAFRKGNLITLAARPGMGKTAVLISFALNIAKSGNPVLLFSIEMSYEELLYRMVIHQLNGKIANEALQSGNLTPQEILDKQQAEYELMRLPITVTDRPQNLTSIQRKTKRWAAENPNGIAMVDYLQLVNVESKAKNSRVDDVSEIARGLKDVAKDCMIPFIGLSQLNRSVETRGTDKRPINSDLAQSGEIENASDMIVMLYRDSYYDIMQDANGESTQGVMEWIIRKNRHGAIGMYKVYHNEKMSNFSEDRSTLINYAQAGEYEPSSINTLKPNHSSWDSDLDF